MENDLQLRSIVREHRRVEADENGKLIWNFTGTGYVCGLEIIEEPAGDDAK